MDTTVTTEGPRVWISYILAVDDFVVRRFVDLRSGETVAALRTEPDPPLPGAFSVAMGSAKSAVAMNVFSDATSANGQRLRAFYDPKTDAWEFKLPWRELGAAGMCERFVLDSSPPALLLGCNSVRIFSEPGSDASKTIEGSSDFASGAGNAGLAVWSEVPPGLPKVSRLRTFSVERGAELLVESMPGVACGVAVSESHVAGLRSGDPAQATSCSGFLAAPEFWSVPRGGGEVSSWPVPDAEPVSVAYGTTWGGFSAVMTYTELRADQAPAERTRIWLIRFADGAMRRITPTAGFEWSEMMFALDDAHLYVGENLESVGITALERIYRYDLGMFEEIGEPMK